jgi:hypothetical protein
MRLRATCVYVRMVMTFRATMRLLRGNDRRAVRRGGESGGVEHAGQAPSDEQRDEDKP